MTAALLVWQAAGCPDPDGAAAALLTDEPAGCALCGCVQPRTAPAGRAMGGNFTDQYLYRRPDSDRVCTGCLWVCSGRPPRTLRMWSVVCYPGAPPSHPKAWLQTPGLCLTNRADPTPVINVLTCPPAGEWVCTVALSGQKHVVPYARVNGAGAWTVRMENTDVTSTPGGFAAALRAAAVLRAAGHSADAILTGQPDIARISTAADLDLWRTHHATLTPHHHGPLLQLALWCITKGTVHDLI